MTNGAERQLAHDRLGEKFGEVVSLYDTNRRLEVLIDEFLAMPLEGKSALDVGCGLGFFSERLKKKGAEVTSVDIGETMVSLTEKRAGTHGIVASALELERALEPESFDVVVSSECIEHTPEPSEAVRQMIRVLKPEGLLSISTPSVLWYPLVRLSTILKLRPYDGLENFSSWRGLIRLLEGNGVTLLRQKGLHLLPFQLPIHGLLRWTDDHCQFLRRLMINICLLGQKNH